jgi:hypothetical protein
VDTAPGEVGQGPPKGEDAREPGPLEWRTQPLKQLTGPVLVISALFVALILYAVLWAGDAVLAALVVLAMAYVLGPLLVPTRFRLDDTGVSRRSALTRRHFRWNEFAGYRVDPKSRAVFLRYAGRGVARFRSALALFTPDEAIVAEVVRRLDVWLPPAGRGS